MKYIFFALSCLNAFTLAAQNSKWDIGLTVAPSFSREWKLSNPDLAGTDEVPRSRFSYAAGLTLIKNRNSRASFQTGCWFMHKKILSVYSLQHTQQSVEAVKIHRFFNDLEIPLLYRVQAGYRKLSFTSSIGAILGVNIFNKEIAESKTINYIVSARGQSLVPSRYNVYLSLGCKYEITPNKYLLIEPFFKPDVTKFLGGSTFDHDNRTLGISTSIVYSR